MPGRRHRSAARAIWTASILAAAVLGVLVAAPGASAAGRSPMILSPSPSRAVAGKTTMLRVRGSHFQVSVGSRDLTKRLGRPVDGVRSLRLRRGKDFHLGSNRIVVSTGKGRHRRYLGRVFLAARPAKLLKLRRLHGRLASVEYEGHSKAKLGRLLVLVNGRRFAQQDLVGNSGRSFRLQLGLGDGLRYGRNRIVVQGVSADGERVSRLERSVRVPRSRPLVDAGDDRRVAVGRTVRLGGRAQPAHRGGPLTRAWQIVAAPRGSKARLKRAGTRHPRLVTDLPGNYRLRLFATEPARRPAEAGAATASAAAPEGADVMTLEAGVTDSPLGVPVETLAAGGILVGDQTYAPPSTPGESPWVQVLILDRSTLAEVANKVVPTEDGAPVVGPVSLELLQEALDGATSEDLVILSGGDRAISAFEPADDGTSANSEVEQRLAQIGVAGGPESSPNGPATLKSGEWSAIGVPDAEVGSGSVNFSGFSSGGFGNQLPAGRPGSLQGYLHFSPVPTDPSDSDLGSGFVFVSPDHAVIDTEAPGGKAGTVAIQVDGPVYEQSVPPGTSGFDLLLLNHRLEPISNQTYVTNVAGGAEELKGVEAFRDALVGLVNGSPRPSLVVLQSFGHPGGQSSYWVADSGIKTFPWGWNTTAESTQLHNEFSEWYEPQTGVSIAAEIGVLAGPAAHDQFAQMVSTQPTAEPAYSGGYTLVAPYEESRAAYSQSEVGSHLRSARVAGEILLNSESNWEVEGPSESAAFSDELLNVVYQAPQPWPDSGTPGFEAADRYLAEKLHLQPLVDVREAYYLDDYDTWSSLGSQLAEKRYPGKGHGFTKQQFELLKKQLLREFPMVEAVQNLIKVWRQTFSGSAGKGKVDLQSIATDLEVEIQENIASQQAELGNAAATADATGIAANLVGLTGVGAPLGAALGALSEGISLSEALSTTKAGSSPTLPIKAKASELGEQLSIHYEVLQANLEQVGNILVGDWGKLQIANEKASNAQGGWQLNSQTEPVMVDAFSDSTSRGVAAAMMPLAYGEYLVTPVPSLANPSPAEPPWKYDCGATPLGAANGNPNSWIAFPYELAGNAEEGFKSTLQARVMAIQGSFPHEGDEFGEYVEAVYTKVTPGVLSKSFAAKLFEAPIAGGYGLDRVQFFGDPAFRRWPLYC